MKICFSGTQCVGKSTVVNDFLAQWPMYKKADNSYRDKVKANPKVKLNQNGNEDSQVVIRDALIDQVQMYSKYANIVFDRCIFDYIAYTLWLNAKGKVSDLFVEKQIPIIRETMKMYDIIFFIPILKNYPITIVPSKDGQRDLDPLFREEIDNIMKAVYKDYLNKKRVFFPQEDCTGVLELFGSQQERIEMIKLYINPKGGLYGEQDSLLKDIKV